MKLMRIGPTGGERPVVRAGDRWLDPTTLTDDIGRSFLAADPVALVELEIEGLGRQRQRVVTHDKVKA